MLQLVPRKPRGRSWGSSRLSFGFCLFASLLLVAPVARAKVTPDTAHAAIPLTGTEEGCAFTKLDNLCFGGMFTSPSPGTVTVSPSGTATYAGGVYAHTTGGTGSAVSAALIELNLTNPVHCEDDDHATNDNNEYDRNEDDDNEVNDSHTSFTRHGMQCSLTLSSSTYLTRVGGSEQMKVDTYTTSRTKGEIAIGATLHVSGNQKSGSYSGTFYVTLDYQ